MSWPSKLFRRRAADSDVEKELRFHIEQQIDEYTRAGMSRAEAARRTRLEFGGLQQVKEDCRDALIVRWWDDLVRDVRLAIRGFRRSPLLFVVAVATLALGIGANTAIFSLVNSLVLRDLPVREPGKLVLLTEGSAPHAKSWTYPVWEQIQQRPELFQNAAAWSPFRFDVASGGETEFVDGVWASGSFFDTLGVPALLGRTLSNADDRSGGGADGLVAVVSYEFWQRRFGGAADAVGRSLRLDGAAFTIVGVTPPGFFGVDVGRTFDVVVPLADEPIVRGRDTYLDTSKVVNFLRVVGRLRPGQSQDEAAAGLRGVQQQIRNATIGYLAQFGPQASDGYLTSPFALVPAARGYSDTREEYERPLLTLMFVVALVLFIACVNIANLLLARAIAMRHEVSVRLALGASRWQLARRLFIESLMLAGAGSALGLLIARWSSRALVQQLATPGNSVSLDLSIDGRVLAFTLGLSLLTTVLFGTVPALRALRVGPIDTGDRSRGTEGHSNGSLAGWLVVAQVALSVVLLVCAGLFIRTFASLTARSLGFDASQILVVRVDAQRAIADPRQRIPLFESARQAVERLPNVSGAAVSMTAPFGGNAFVPPVEIAGVPLSETTRLQVAAHLISPGWFDTFGMPLVAGRDLTDRDRGGGPRVAVVNETFVRKFLGGSTPLGRSFTLFPNSTFARPTVIVGVVGDAIYASLRDPVPPTFYAPIDQFEDMPEGFLLPWAELSVRARTGSPAVLTQSVITATADVNPGLALTFRPLAASVSASVTQERVVAMLSGCFGCLALLLAGLGLYGVTSYGASQRRTEIGIRMALGATSRSVVRLVLLRVAWLVGAGIVVGAVISAWASTFVESLLYGLQPRDPATFVGAAAILSLVAVIASYLPARRATKVDPVIALRCD